MILAVLLQLTLIDRLVSPAAGNRASRAERPAAPVRGVAVVIAA